jgi:adenosylcobyric acid synthase
MTARPIFVGGTGSHVGKSWVATALCRYLFRMGHRVAPFKAQNMSNNSMVCSEGGEIGRAQAAQAEACGLEPHPDMNPILLKPTGTFGSQVVLNGRPWRNLKAAEYYTHFDFLLENVVASYSRLAANYDTIVIEGAGSVSELNLKNRDLVNLGLASRLNAPVILVADIDRGGVFASLIGTFHLLDESESPLVRSFLINRFRGDSSLFRDGVEILEQRTKRRCLGVFPFADEIRLDAEDSVSLEQRPQSPCAAADDAYSGCSRVAIIRLPHISNFTDFRLMSFAKYVTAPSEEQFDIIFLPGTKSTIEDMLWLRSTGMERWLLQQVQGGARVVGVCGGFQMLGEEITDPDAVESPVREIRGVGLIPAKTRLSREKITRTVAARTPSGIHFDAYEIHMGITVAPPTRQPFAQLTDGIHDGIRLPNVMGTYLHGALENKAVLEEILGHSLPASCMSTKDVAYDRLADWFAGHVNRDVLMSEYLEGARTCVSERGR